ncbi:MAG: AI-2E family transporter [Paludibacteraceae bacterium]|nr:AI-2E family transporter [Paludibacteraceae bacterium]
MFEKPFTLDSTVRLIIRLSIFSLLIYTVYVLNDVLLPFVAAWFVAYMLNPIVNFFQKKVKIKNRTASVLLVLVLLLGALVGFVYFLINSLSKEIYDIELLIQQYISNSAADKQPTFISVYIKEILESVNLNESLKGFSYKEFFNKLIPQAFNMLSVSFKYIAGMVVLFLFTLYLFFIMKDFDNLSEKWNKYVPHRYRDFSTKLVSDMGKYMNTYFRKQALISIIVGTLFAIAFSIIGLEMAVGLGMLIAVLHMIPYMHTLGSIPAVFIALVQSAQSGDSFGLYILYIVLAFGIIQVIIDAVLVPKIMGDATGLNPAIILLSLSIWGALLGILGMIIALPITTLIVSYYEFYVLEKGVTLEEEVKDE